MIAMNQNPTSNDFPRRNPRNPRISLEVERTRRGVGGFDWQESERWAYHCWKFGRKLSQEELVSNGRLVAVKLRIKLDRDARRRKAVMVKWFEENWLSSERLLRSVIVDKNDTQGEEMTVNGEQIRLLLVLNLLMLVGITDCCRQWS
jgi:hypothetical protein